MNTFDDIFGYEKEKKELRQICDIARDPERYARLGVRMPRGILLFGDPGVGKTLMAMAVVNELGRKCFVCRRNSSSKDFLSELYNVFEEAKKEAPSVVLLDDMDKFAMTERGDRNRDKEEYVAVQSGIDGLKDADVLVIATANATRAFPDSLLRPGRFDCKIHVRTPRIDESRCIMERYLQGKKVADDVDCEKLAWILEGHSAAVLEGVLNRAAIYAGYRGADAICMDDFVDACMHVAYNTDFDDDDDDEDFDDEDDCVTVAGSPEYIATHEAGHAIATQILRPGTIRFVTTRGSSDEHSGGKLVAKRIEDMDDVSRKEILTCLAGKAATELRYGIVDPGASSDIAHACNSAMKLLTFDCEDGIMDFRKIGYRAEHSDLCDDKLFDKVQAELERDYEKAKDILRENWDAVLALADRLTKRDVVFGDEIEKMCEG